MQSRLPDRSAWTARAEYRLRCDRPRPLRTEYLTLPPPGGGMPRVLDTSGSCRLLEALAQPRDIGGLFVCFARGLDDHRGSGISNHTDQ